MDKLLNMNFDPVKIKISNIKMQRRLICYFCGTVKTDDDKCSHCGKNRTDLQVSIDGEHWDDEQYVCHEKPMKVGSYCRHNGWQCQICGYVIIDRAADKLGEY